MHKSILIQSPKKFYEAVPIFYKEAEKFGFLDKFYIATDQKDTYGLGKNCIVNKLKKDRQFSSNILATLPMIEEDVFFLCCEDHIFMPGNEHKAWQKCFDFVRNHKKAGYLRMTNNNRIKLTSKDFIAPIHKKDKYYISLQPGIWRKEFLKHVLEHGEDAWKFEINGAIRAKRHGKLFSFCTQESVFHRTNFYKQGKYYRHKFAEYAIRNRIKLGRRKVERKGKLFSFEEYEKLVKNDGK